VGEKRKVTTALFLPPRHACKTNREQMETTLQGGMKGCLARISLGRFSLLCTLPLVILLLGIPRSAFGIEAAGANLHRELRAALATNTGLDVSFSVFAVSPTSAWIGGIEDIARTSDGGISWTMERPSNTAWFCLEFLDSENSWAGGQDQDIDDVPGSIWKRSGPAESVPNQNTSRVPLSFSTDLNVHHQSPPSGPPQ